MSQHARRSPSWFGLLLAITLFVPLRTQAADSDIRISSIGYLPDRIKRAAIIMAAAAFEVRRAADGSLAFSGVVTGPVADETGHQVRTADFTAFAEQGLFYLNVPGVGQSRVFRIASDVTFNSFLLQMRGFYGWRCGSAVNLSHRGTTFAHPVCHLNDGIDYAVPNTPHVGTAGWHDAGDYGKYTVNAAFAAGELLTAWEHFSPSLSSIVLHEIPE